MRRQILFVGHDFKFLEPLLEHFEARPVWEVLTHSYRGHVLREPGACTSLAEGADVLFAEWCLGNAEWLSARKREDQALIVRLHSQERNLPFLDRIIWSRVDRLCFICRHHMETFLERFPSMSNRSRLIYNAIDCAAFDLPKTEDAPFHLGLMGMAPMQKSPHLAVEILERLREQDSRTTLFFKGHHPSSYDWLWKRPDERAYYEALFDRLTPLEAAGAVVFDPHGDDVPQWFRKVGFILSTSEHEGSHQAVAEGMASGTIPVIRNWRGADQLYPARYVFDTVDLAVERILEMRANGTEAGERAFCRAFARTHFDQSTILPQYEALIEELLEERKGSGQTAPSER
jgi:glycosyltransferase involved in cell wall biosynthesis